MRKFKKHWAKITLTLALSGVAAALSHYLPANDVNLANAQIPGSPRLVAQGGTGAQTPASLMPTYTVVACNDGDTCRLKAADNTQIKVRLVGIDAPEMGKKSKKKKKEGQSGGKEAKEFLNNLVVGKVVTLKSYGADAYGRNLAEIMLNKESANLKMVSEGWAEVYRGRPPRGLDLTAYQTAESDAQKNKKGIWSLTDYESPKEFRKKNRD
jgi:endonuclease YncB( thermonuclease family)